MAKITKMKIVMVAPATALLFANVSFAGTIINEDWSGYSNGAVPTSPWSIGQVVAGDNDSVTVQNGYLYYNNAGTGGTNYNPEVSYAFTSTTEKLNISFSYRIPTFYSGSQIVFRLRSDTGTAVYLTLGTSYYNNGISYRGPGSDQATATHGVGHTFTANETVQIQLKDIDLTTGTYQIVWSSSTGASGSASAVFYSSVTNFTSIFVSDNTGGNIVSQLYLGPITVASVPEPASLATLSCGALLLARRAKRRS